MKYDDASWHYGGEFPPDLPDSAGATHTGMYLAWALLAGLSSELHTVEFPGDIASLRNRAVTPGAFFLAACDGKFTDEDLSEEGNTFTEAYFSLEHGQFLEDYELTLALALPEGRDSLYHVADSWENFDLIKPVLDGRLAGWRALQRRRVDGPTP